MWAARDCYVCVARPCSSKASAENLTFGYILHHCIILMETMRVNIRHYHTSIFMREKKIACKSLHD